jgi:hypothetical protein
MSKPMADVHERRQFSRVTPVQRIRGTVGSVVVFLIDVSLGSARVAHQDALPAPGGMSILTFDWDGRRFSAPCEVRRTTVEKAPKTEFDKPLYHSGLVLEPDGPSDRILRDIVAASVARALDEQKANANGIPALAAQSVQTGKGDDFIRYEFRGGSWSRTATREPRQPHGEGFTISASEAPAKAAMLCRAYESGDVEGRRLIRTFASLSISKSEGVPTRRYTP